MEESCNSVDLITNHAKKIDKTKRRIPKSALRLFGVLPKKKENKDGIFSKQ